MHAQLKMENHNEMNHNYIVAATDTHCAFSSNLFHGQIAQIHIDQTSDPESKNVALEKFLERTTLKPLDF